MTFDFFIPYAGFGILGHAFPIYYTPPYHHPNIIQHDGFVLLLLLQMKICKKEGVPAGHAVSRRSDIHTVNTTKNKSITA